MSFRFRLLLLIMFGDWLPTLDSMCVRSTAGLFWVLCSILMDSGFSSKYTLQTVHTEGVNGVGILPTIPIIWVILDTE